MDNFIIEKASGYAVSCVKEIPPDPKLIVIAVHGFSSSKEGSTYRLLLNTLPQEGSGVICPDLPGHGSEESAKETLRISGAIDSIEAVEKYALREYPGCRICFFASSFGAYLTGLYISSREHAARRLFWRSAAVNMPELFCKENPSLKERQQLEELEKKGYFDADFDPLRPVRITKEMFNDLRENNLFERFDPDLPGDHRIAMAHGRQDNVISPEAAGKFADLFGIPVTWFEGEGHSLANDPATPKKVIHLASDLYNS